MKVEWELKWRQEEFLQMMKRKPQRQIHQENQLCCGRVALKSVHKDVMDRALDHTDGSPALVVQTAFCRVANPFEAFVDRTSAVYLRGREGDRH